MLIKYALFLQKVIFLLYIWAMELTFDKRFLKVCPNKVILTKKIEQNLVMSRETYSNMIVYICYFHRLDITSYEHFILAVSKLSLSIQYN